MKRISALLLTIAICLGYAELATAQCVFSGAVQVPANSPFQVGPTVYAAVVANIDVGNAILAARDAWDATHAVNRIGDWSNTVSGSDCPAGQPAGQIGAFDFLSVSCSTVTAYQAYYGLAFTDWNGKDNSDLGNHTDCPECGTLSISVNLNYAFSVTPSPGQYDLQSLLAHEFGHVLGLRHLVGSACSESDPGSCAQDSSRNTMGKYTYPATSTSNETCMRDLSQHDIDSANAFY